MWTYHAYRFVDEAAYETALLAVGWDQGTPPGVDLLVVGKLYLPSENPGEPGDLILGWHVAAAFKAQEQPAGWLAFEIVPPAGMPTLGQVFVPTLSDYEALLDNHVETAVSVKGYKSAASCASYINSAIPAWKADAEAFLAWRDTFWAQAYARLTKVQNGEVEPSMAALLASLPKMQWPS